ncbi:g4345 [Coccomyxa elongata]
MEDNSVAGVANTRFDRGGKNSIKLPYNVCGCVYALDVNQSYVAQKMSALVCGNTASNTDALNRCDKKGISSPDNLSMMRGYNKLIIGEDTGTHQNDVIWLYDFADKSLKRLQTTPYGSETTSPYWYENINGCAYFVSVVQHPYEESDNARITDNASTGRASYVGYLGPLKASTRKAPVKAPFKVADAVVDQVQTVTETINKEVDTIQEAKP